VNTIGDHWSTQSQQPDPWW